MRFLLLSKFAKNFLKIESRKFSMEGLLTYLKSQDIKFRNEQHEEVFTVEAMMQQKGLGFIYQLFDIFSY